MIVIDSSIAVAGLMQDENDPLADLIVSDLTTNKQQALVPILFHYEVSNALLMSFRKKRIGLDLWMQYTHQLHILPVFIYNPTYLHNSLMAINKISEEHKLTFYDATYLELAIRRNIPLATLDKELYAAAEKVGLAFRG